MKNTIFIAVIYLTTLILILNMDNTHALQIKLTKIKCNLTDTSFAIFEKCRVKAESRDLQYVILYVRYLQLPIKEADVRFRFMKRANGYKPFLYDFIFNCDFLKHMTPIKKLLWGWFTTVSNLNHSCPLTENFEIKRLENRYLNKELNLLPMPAGDYALFVDFYTKKTPRFYIEFYSTIY